MGRVNKTISGVFIDIVGTSNEISQYQQFINQGGDLNDDPQVREYLSIYTHMINNNKEIFEQLASLEEIIMQKRIQLDLSDIKLSKVRDYVYARTPFYRKNNSAKDIRVIVDKMEFYPQCDGDLTILFGNQEFMERAKVKLASAMETEIANNIALYDRQQQVLAQM